MDLRGFGRKMQVTGKDVVDNTDRLIRKVAVAVDHAVVLGTPVDTGRARSNWQASLDRPAEGTVAPLTGVNKGHKGSGTAVARASIARAESVIAGYNGDKNSAIHLTNNLPYIGRLNDGWSAQAPAGFVEAAVHAGASVVRGAKVTVKGGVS